ncbi:hypothetical protein C6I20_07220 [Aeromicrobium sp. A1-2]|nr:hypothetical protein C6I20_07220 [Aeromicrobium sp. A1-2]
MLSPASGAVRMIRSLAVALLCTVTAGVGHASVGGTIPSGAVAVVFVGATLVAWLLSSHRVTPGQLVGLLILCQVGVHFGSSSGEMTMPLSMLVAHLVATAVSAAALARSEAFVWQLAERLGLRVAPHDLKALAVPSWRPATPIASARTLADLRLAYSRAERGPPNGS